MTQSDLENLVQYGFTFEFRTIKMTSTAAKLRVLKNFEHEVDAMWALLQQERLKDSTRPILLEGNSFVDNLRRQRAEVTAAGVHF